MWKYPSHFQNECFILLTYRSAESGKSGYVLILRFGYNHFSIKGQIGNANHGTIGDRVSVLKACSLSLSLLLASRKNRINKRNRRYVEVGLRAIPRVNSTRFSTFAIKGRIYPNGRAADPSTLLYLSRSIPRCLCDRRQIDAPTDGFY